MRNICDWTKLKEVSRRTPPSPQLQRFDPKKERRNIYISRHKKHLLKEVSPSTPPSALLQPQRPWSGFFIQNKIHLYPSFVNFTFSFHEYLFGFEILNAKVQVWNVETGDHIVTFGDESRQLFLRFLSSNGKVIKLEKI